MEGASDLILSHFIHSNMGGGWLWFQGTEIKHGDFVKLAEFESIKFHDKKTPNTIAFSYFLLDVNERL